MSARGRRHEARHDRRSSISRDAAERGPEGETRARVRPDASRPVGAQPRLAYGTLLGLLLSFPAAAVIEERPQDAGPAAGAAGIGIAPLRPSAPGSSVLAPPLHHDHPSGWTEFEPSADTLQIFVSSASGSDQADGLSPATAKKTIAAGKALVRHGYPDWLRLKRGDVWPEALGQWKTSGRSADEPMVVTTYGTARARPLLHTGSGDGLWITGGGGAPPVIKHVAFVGLHFQADTFTGSGDCVGARLLLPSIDILIEDCLVEGYATNLVFQGFGGRHADFRLRRSVIVDAFAIHGSGVHPQGLYAYAVDGLLIEENVFDHNGWSETVPGAGADIFSHNLYIDNDNTGVVVRRNIIANASSHGLQLRPGGQATDNLFVRNSIALSVGGGNNPEPGGVLAEVRKNVILDAKDISAGQPRGWGMWFGNIAAAEVAQNVIANNALGTQPLGIALDGAYVGDVGPSAGVHNVVLAANIVFDWGWSLVVVGDGQQVTRVTMLANDLQDATHPAPLIFHDQPATLGAFSSAANRFFAVLLPDPEWTQIGPVAVPINQWTNLIGDSTSVSAQAAYADPHRSIASYQASLGKLPSLSAFLAEARKQGAASWRPEYTAANVNQYIRAGFGLTGP
jgi:hypothetical protein